MRREVARGGRVAPRSRIMDVGRDGGSTATRSRTKARSDVHGPNGCPSTQPVTPASRRIATSRRSAAESARSPAAASRRRCPGEPR
ncbi:MAG: hypothetical protein AB7G09_25565, partial [Pseudonocardia sp.]